MTDITTVSLGVVLFWFFMNVVGMMVPLMILYAVIELFVRLLLSPLARLVKNG